jgi:uncharacterized membrane protein YadS
MEERKSISEDWLAFWLAIAIFAISLLAYIEIDPLGWVVSTKEWIDPSKAIIPTGKAYQGLPGLVSLVLTYIFIAITCTICVALMRRNIIKFNIGFFFVFWLSYLCWFIGHYAFFAATDPQKFNIPWSLKLTGEGGFIFALVLGLIIGNFFRSFAQFINEALLPEFYIKTAIGLMGALLGLKSAQAFGLASTILFMGLCAVIVAYLIFWALVYWIARKWFKFSKEWSAPLASGISICGVSAAIATGGAIKARPIVPIMVASLVVIFAVVELVILPFFAQAFLWKEPMVAGAWMGLAVKTDGAAFASGAVVEALIRAKTETVAGIKYEPGWILMAASTTKLFIDIFISIWAFILAYIWCTKIEYRPGERVSAREIWRRFPKFIMAYAITFVITLIISIPHAPKIAPIEAQIKKINKEVAAIEKQLSIVKGEALKAQLTTQIEEKKKKIKELEESIKDSKKIISYTSTAASGTNALRVLFFLITFFTIGVMSDFRKLWEEGIGKLALVYFVALFGFILWIGLLISYAFYHGIKPPIITE